MCVVLSVRVLIHHGSRSSKFLAVDCDVLINNWNQFPGMYSYRHKIFNGSPQAKPARTFSIPPGCISNRWKDGNSEEDKLPTSCRWLLSESIKESCVQCTSFDFSLNWAFLGYDALQKLSKYKRMFPDF